MATHKYNIILNGKVERTFFTMLEALQYVKENGGRVKVTKI